MIKIERVIDLTKEEQLCINELKSEEALAFKAYDEKRCAYQNALGRLLDIRGLDKKGFSPFSGYQIIDGHLIVGWP